MRISSDEEAPLKEHLKSALHPLCEADPELLADYVIALLKNDSSHEELAASLREALTDFLGDNTEVSHPSAFPSSLSGACARTRCNAAKSVGEMTADPELQD